jgi:hypothetical protein
VYDQKLGETCVLSTEDVTGGCIKLHSKGLRNLYSLENITALKSI